jgi:hypothetical protein
VTALPSATTRSRRLPAVLLGVLAVFASLVVGPAATTAPAAAAASASTSAVRALAPFGSAVRDARQHPRALPRRGTRDHSGSLIAAERRAPAGHGPAPSAAVLALVVGLTVLAAGGLAARRRTGHFSRRTPGTLRDRAPPVPALA